MFLLTGFKILGMRMIVVKYFKIKYHQNDKTNQLKK